jgi:SAM-dependent methyltransferase
MSKDHKLEQFDYKKVHKDIKQAINYESNVYADDSYDSCIWELEKEILAIEIGLIKKKEIKYFDFACGTGRIISYMESLADESTGIDVSENMLNIAKSKVQKAQLFLCDLITNDIINDKLYDLITAFRFFLNAQDDLRTKIMPLLSAKLNNDGIIIFNIHGNSFSFHLLPVILGRLGIKKVKLNHLSYFKTLKLINNSNLNLIRVYGVGFVPSSFYRRFKSKRELFVRIEKACSRNRFLKYFARNLIFICIKRKTY